MILFAAQYHGSGRRRRGVLGWIWNVVTWPFRTVERLESRVADWSHRRRERFHRKYRHSKVLAPLIGALVRILLAPFRLVWFVLTAPFRVIGAASSQVQTVRKQRELMHLLQGLPAAVATIGVFVVLMMLTLQQPNLAQDYRVEASQAYDDSNFRRARLYLQRVLQLGADTKQTSYLFARTLDETGDKERAAAILDSLAPDDPQEGEGYPEAHLWKAEFLVDDPATLESEEGLRKVHRHLLIAENSLSLQGDSDLDYYLGRFYLAIGQNEKALSHLKKVVNVRPELNIDLYRLSERLGNKAEAQEHLALAVPYLSDELKSTPGDEPTRIQLAQLLVHSGDYETTFDILQEGISLNPDGPFKEMLAEAYVYRYATLPGSEASNITHRLELLSQALKIDPDCKPALNALIYFGDNGSADAAAIGQAREALESLIAVGESAPLAHFALGIKAWNNQETGDAVWHLERAYKLDPSVPNLANNVAYLLTQSDVAADWERALALINSVLEQHPGVEAYLETRGQVYVKLSRWDEALDDLERALPVYQREIRLHESLALVYDNLGQEGLANKHRNVVANLRDSREGN